MEEALRYDCKVLVEEAITGAEVECAVMGNHHNAIPSDVIGEIVPLREMYDYEGKYLDGSTQLYIPARIPEAQTELIRQAAVKAYRALDCRGLSRVDFFALPDGTIRLNEINTLPGFTNISMFPKLFMASGYTYPQLLDRLYRAGAGAPLRGHDPRQNSPIRGENSPRLCRPCGGGAVERTRAARSEAEGRPKAERNGDAASAPKPLPEPGPCGGPAPLDIGLTRRCALGSPPPFRGPAAEPQPSSYLPQKGGAAHGPQTYRCF